MRGIAVASGTADVQGVSGYVQLRGVSVRESAATPAAAALVLRDGTLATDPARVFIELVANESKFISLDGTVEFWNGVFVDREAGTSELCLFVQ